MDKMIGYYHVYLTENSAIWASIVCEQLDVMLNSGLLEDINRIKIICISRNNRERETFYNLCLTYTNKLEFYFVDNPYSTDREMIQNLESSRTITENITMREIWKDSQTDDFKILYLHTKGVTSIDKHLNTNVDLYMRYVCWRQFLNWGVLDNWKTCTFELQYHDIAGVNYQKEPSAHFSGNFWWANSSYIRKLPDPATLDWWYKIKSNTTNDWLKSASDRFRDEQWPCSIEHKVFDVYTPEINPVSKLTRRNEYIEKKNLFWHPV